MLLFVDLTVAAAKWFIEGKMYMYYLIATLSKKYPGYSVLVAWPLGRCASA